MVIDSNLTWQKHILCSASKRENYINLKYYHKDQVSRPNIISTNDDFFFTKMKNDCFQFNGSNYYHLTDSYCNLYVKVSTKLIMSGHLTIITKKYLKIYFITILHTFNDYPTHYFVRWIFTN